MSDLTEGKPAIILLAEDNPADQQLTKRALEEGKVQNKLFIVEDGVETMEYLQREGKYKDPKSSPKPDIILLDINMPKMDGKKVLEQLKTNPNLKTIPVVVLTTSSYEQDVIESYKLGVNAYITKPVDFNQFIKVIHSLEYFWLRVVVLPPKPNSEE